MELMDILTWQSTLFSLRLLNNNSLLLCDDILKSKPVIEDNIYQSSAGNETLIALQKAKLIKYKLYLSR